MPKRSFTSKRVLERLRPVTEVLEKSAERHNKNVLYIQRWKYKKKNGESLREWSSVKS